MERVLQIEREEYKLQFEGNSDRIMRCLLGLISGQKKNKVFFSSTFVDRVTLEKIEFFTSNISKKYYPSIFSGRVGVMFHMR